MRVFVAGASAIGTRPVPQLVERGHEVIGTLDIARQSQAGASARGKARRPRSARRGRRAPGRLRRPRRTRSSIKRPHWRSGPRAISTARSRGRTGCGPRAPTRCSRPHARGGGQPVRRSELRQLPERARGRAGQDRERPARSRPGRDDARVERRHALSRGNGHERRRDRASLRHLLRRRQRRADRAGARQFPIVGDGGGISSFIHLDDAAAATVLALEHDGPGIFNVVDDEPAPVREWLPVLAGALGARPPAAFPAGSRGCSPARPW